MKINSRYNIIEKLSESQNSIIYKVTDIRSNNIFVLKQLMNSDPKNIMQFKREFSILQTFSHPHIVKVFDIGTFKKQKNNYYYYTMEYVEGIPFDSYAKNHKYPEVISTFVDILNIIGFVHKKGYIHCDLKPNHLIIDKQGVVRLVDFGFVQFQKAIVAEEIGGTLRYIAPEILKGEEPDVRTDIYSLGIILYESITGSKLFDYNKTYKIIDAVMNEIPPPIKDRNIPEYIKETAMKMFNKQRLNRFTSVNDIIDILNSKDKVNPENEFIEKILYSDFIGREKYVTKVLKLIENISAEQGQILILDGVPGVGKTRFLKEIEHQLLLNKGNVNYIKLIEDEQFKFNWLLDLIEIMDVDISYIRSMIKEGKINLSITGRYQFFKIIETAMNKIPSDKIHTFLIDDSNITDQIIIDFILYFADILSKKQFLFIFSTEKVLSAFNKLLSDQIYSNINLFELNGLNKNETAKLIKNILGVTENISEITNYLFEETDGNPFFIEQILINIIDKKLLKRKGDILNYNISEIKHISISKNFNTVMEKEFAKLNSKEKLILKITSIFGESIPINWLERILKYSESEIIRMLDGYTLKRIFNITEDNKLYFLHRLTKTGVNNLIDDKEKILIHKKILGFLETLEQSHYILQLKAHHAFFAKSKNAKDYLVNLLNQSVKLSDENFIIKSFERLKALGEIDNISGFNKRILDKVGNVYYYKGKFNEALSVYNIALDGVKMQNDKIGISRRIAMTYIAMSDYEKAENIFDNLLKGELEIENRFNVSLDSGWLYYTLKNYDKAKDIYKKALILSTRLENKMILGKLYYNLSTLHYMLDEFVESEYYGKKVIEIGSEYKNDYYLMAGYNMLAIIYQKRRDYKSALEYYRKSLDVIEKTEDLQRRLNIFTNRIKIYFYMGEIRKCKEICSESIIIAKRLGDKYNIALLYNLYGNILYQKGEWEQAIKYYNLSCKISLGNREYIIYLESLLNISYIYLYQGKEDDLCKFIEKAQKVAINIKDEKEKISLTFMKGLISYIDCKFEVAYSYFSEVSDKSGKIDKIEMEISSLIYESECLLHLYRNDDALNAIEKAGELINQHVLFHYKDECEYVKILINESKMSDDILESHLNDLLNRTKENQKFLYARILMQLSDIYYNAISTGDDQDKILKSISLLKEARLIFKNMKAIKYLLDIDNKLFESYERLKDILSFSERGNKKYYDTILKFSTLMNNLENPVEFKKALVSMAKTFTGAERGLFFTLDENSNELIATGEDVDDATIFDAKEFSRNVIRKATKTKKTIIATDAISDNKFKNYDSVRINQIRSILCIPIISKDKVLGTLYLDSRKRSSLFSNQEKEFFNAISTLLANSLRNALEFKRLKDEKTILDNDDMTYFGPLNIVGHSKKMREVFERIKRFAESNVPVLILGESGTGKELTAHTIHLMSNRKDNTMLLIDCSSLSPTLVESELFGYKKGAFTGAREDKIGHFEAAEKGTLFIDEISNASDSLQARLLRFLDTREVKKIGSTKYKRVNTNIIIASNQNLYELTQKGKFRADLFYRLSGFVILLPPLRERREDIRYLLNYFISHYNKRFNKKIRGVTGKVFEALYNYNWPGNIREFKNEIERCVFFCDEKLVEMKYISEGISYEKPNIIPLKDMKRRFMKDYVNKVVNYMNGNISKTARVLKTDTKTVYRYLNKK